MTERSPDEAAAQLQALLDSAKDLGIFALDRSYRYLAFNDGHRQMMHALWGVDIRPGQSLLDDVVRRVDDRANIQAHCDRALAGETFAGISDLGDSARLRKHFECTCAPLRSSTGDIIGLTCVMRDGTEAQRNEQARQDLVRRHEELSGIVAENSQMVDRLRGVISELTTPVLEIWDSVLALPVVGIIDTERGEQMNARLLAAIQQHRARFVIIDLTGVNTLDTSTANRFMQMARAARLLGSEAIIAGIQAAVAQTLVALGVDLGGLTSTRNLKQALEHCISRLHAERGGNAARRG